jgi:uncharacterized protein YbjT (DUF2867 family)
MKIVVIGDTGLIGAKTVRISPSKARARSSEIHVARFRGRW